MLLASEVPRLAVVELTNVRGFEDLTLTLTAHVPDYANFLSSIENSGDTGRLSGRDHR